MEAAVYIIAVAAAACYLGLFEFPVALAPAASCSALRRPYRVLCTVVCLAAGVALSARAGISFAGAADLPAAIGAALLSAFVCRAVSPYNSVVYAIVGAMAGWRIATAGVAGISYMLPVAWIAAAAICGVLALAVFRIYAAVVAAADVHFIRLTSILGLVSVPCAAFMLVAAGFNLGGLFIASDASAAWGPAATGGVAAAVIGAAALLTRRPAGNLIARLSEGEFDIDIVAAQSVVVASGITLLLFSPAAPFPAPLSPVMLAFAALTGIGVGQNRPLLGAPAAIRLFTALFITPAVALPAGYFAAVVLSPDAVAVTADSIVVMLGMSVIVAAVFLVSNHLRHAAAVRSSTRMLREQGAQLSENRRTLNELEIRNMQIENRSLHDQLELKRREVMSIALNITEQKEFMAGLYEKIKAVQAESSPAERQRMLNDIRTDLSQRMAFSSEIDSFYTEVEKLHRDFSIRLTEKFPKLTDSERRLTTLLRLGFSTKYIATLMNISPKSVEIGRHRLRAKLGLDRQQNLVGFIKTI